MKVETKDLSLDVEDKLLINAKPKIDLSKAESKVKAKYRKATIKKLKLDVDDNVLAKAGDSRRFTIPKRL